MLGHSESLRNLDGPLLRRESDNGEASVQRPPFVHLGHKSRRHLLLSVHSGHALAGGMRDRHSRTGSIRRLRWRCGMLTSRGRELGVRRRHSFFLLLHSYSWRCETGTMCDTHDRTTAPQEEHTPWSHHRPPAPMSRPYAHQSWAWSRCDSPKRLFPSPAYSCVRETSATYDTHTHNGKQGTAHRGLAPSGSHHHWSTALLRFVWLERELREDALRSRSQTH